MGQYLLSLDIGTTHCKAGLFDQCGKLIRVLSYPTPLHRADTGVAYYDPDELWTKCVHLLSQVLAGVQPDSILSIGLTGMAETGLLIDRESGYPRTPLIPWFESASAPQAERLRAAGDPLERFCRTGLRPNFKSGLAKILWLRAQDTTLVAGTLWLGAVDFIAYRLSGRMWTDFSLAGRSYAFRLDQRTWDEDWIRNLGLDPGLFPPASASGHVHGGVTDQAGRLIGLKSGTPVSICGHDHVCASFGIGVINPRLVFDSMGTAEALLGLYEQRMLGETEFQSGFAFGCHVLPDLNYWMGGLSASGGSIEWLRSVLAEGRLSYEELAALAAKARPCPSGILYFPYLAGSGSPHTDIRVRAALIGLDGAHSRAELCKAILEGTAFEIDFILRHAEKSLGFEIEGLLASGGGTRNKAWMQIKSDIMGIPVKVPQLEEAALLGAALIAGLGCGVYSNVDDALAARGQFDEEVYMPDPVNHQNYRPLCDCYLSWQKPLRDLAG